MPLFGRLALFAAIAAVPANGLADTFGGWTFDPPDAYERDKAGQGVVYGGPNGKFLFLPQAPTDGRPLGDLARAVIDSTVSPDAQRQEVVSQHLPDGGAMSVWFATDGELAYLVNVVGDKNLAATAIFITPQLSADAIAAETDALVGASFVPVVLVPKDPSRLPPMNWPTPPAGLVAASRPKMSATEGRAAGIDPELQLLRATFDCYRTDEPRAADPRPDLRIESAANGFFTVSDGARTSRGTWKIATDETLGEVLYFSDPFNPGDAVFVHTGGGLGQTFDVDHPFAEGELTCFQDGPAADAARQEMAAVAPVRGLMSCVRADGSTFRLIYADGIYRADGDQGRYIAALDGDYGSWRGKLYFAGGPFDLLDGEVVYDAGGSVKLTLSQTWHEGNMFYSSSETTTIAECRAAVPKRPEPVYGLDPSPPASAPGGGLPEGLYESVQNRYDYSTNLYVWERIVTFVAPGGRWIDSPDLDGLGTLPDCARATPSGEEYCGEYRIADGKLSVRTERQYEADDWSEPASFAIGTDGFTIGDVEYVPLKPTAPEALVGSWSSSDGSSTFSGLGGVSGGVGIYSSSSASWTFSGDGRFTWQSRSDTTTLISPNQILLDSGFAQASGGGGSSSSDSGAGTYTLDGIWLDLVFDDGRTRRFTAFAGGESADGTRYLTIAGVQLSGN